MTVHMREEASASKLTVFNSSPAANPRKRVFLCRQGLMITSKAVPHRAFVCDGEKFDVPSFAELSKGLVSSNRPSYRQGSGLADQSRNVRSNIKRSVNSAVRAAYRSLAAFFIDLRPK